MQPLLGQQQADGFAAAAQQSVLAALLSANFWMLFIIFGTGTGCGLLLLFNLGVLLSRLLMSAHVLGGS